MSLTHKAYYLKLLEYSRNKVKIWLKMTILELEGYKGIAFPTPLFQLSLIKENRYEADDSL